jgi:hypothetical protein
MELILSYMYRGEINVEESGKTLEEKRDLTWLELLKVIDVEESGQGFPLVKR